jgi:hypothetical protein
LVVSALITGLATPAFASPKKHDLQITVTVPVPSLPGTACVTTSDYSDLSATTPLTVRDRSGKKLATATLGNGTGTSDYQCRFSSSARVADAPKYKIDVGQHGTVGFTRTNLRDADWSAGIQVGAKPTTPPTSDQLYIYIGKPCSTSGQKVPLASATGGTLAPANSGLICSDGTWSWIVSAGQACGSLFANKTARTDDGSAVTCTNGYWLAPGQGITNFYAGHYVVGTDTGQVPPGTYQATNVTNCYWERVDGTGHIIDNNYISGAPVVQFTVEPTDAGVNVDGPCGQWHKIG